MVALLAVLWTGHNLAVLWFKTPDGKGKSSLEQQTIGLDDLWDLVVGNTVLDVGCAEGLIARKCLDAGASFVHGVELRKEAVERTRALGVNCDNANVDSYNPRRIYDVVLMLAILHKLAEPAKAFARLLSACDLVAVVRLPYGGWPVLVDSRSGSIQIDLGRVASDQGFRLFQVTDGPSFDGRAQWTGYLYRA